LVGSARSGVVDVRRRPDWSVGLRARGGDVDLSTQRERRIGAGQRCARKSRRRVQRIAHSAGLSSLTLRPRKLFPARARFVSKSIKTACRTEAALIPAGGPAKAEARK